MAVSVVYIVGILQDNLKITLSSKFTVELHDQKQDGKASGRVLNIFCTLIPKYAKVQVEKSLVRFQMCHLLKGFIRLPSSSNGALKHFTFYFD